MKSVRAALMSQNKYLDTETERRRYVICWDEETERVSRRRTSFRMYCCKCSRVQGIRFTMNLLSSCAPEHE